MVKMLPTILALALTSLTLGGCSLDSDWDSSFACFEPGECYRVAIADTPDERARGLMGVAELAADEGMLFDFDTPIGASFWMKDTLIPLRAVWISEEGRVVGSTVMTPCPEGTVDCPTYDSPAPVRWVLEIADAGPAPGTGSVMRIGR